MHHASGTYRLAVLAGLSVLLSIMLPVASSSYAQFGGEATAQHAIAQVEACDHETMPRDMQCGCCTMEAPMPEVPEALLQNSTFKDLTSPPPAAPLDIAPLLKDALGDRLSFSGVYTPYPVRLHVLHATFLN